MNTIFIASKTVCTHHHREPEQYGSWWSHHDFSLVGAYTQRPRENEVDTFKLDAGSGDTVYAVYIEHTDGDSFGTAHGKGELIWCYTTKEKAESLRHYIKDVGGDAVSLEFKDEHGAAVKLSNPTYDYFSLLVTVEVQALVVQ